MMSIHTYTRLTALFPWLPGWAGTRKVKPIWILLKQETVSGSGISWAICKSAPHSRQTTKVLKATCHDEQYKLNWIMHHYRNQIKDFWLLTALWTVVPLLIMLCFIWKLVLVSYTGCAKKLHTFKSFKIKLNRFHQNVPRVSENID